VADNPSFRAPFRRGRCIIPADGFYEWQARPGAPKQPFCIRAASGAILGFAGLRDEWEGPDGALATCTIITTTANGVMAPIHDRMPVILAPGDYSAWLDPATAAARLQDLLRPCPEALLRIYPVGPRVGNVRNEGPGLAEPLDA
jgi:putative SOS response-associated peptidase YedK